MRCKKCNIEVTDSDDAVCPLCNTPLEKDDQDAQQELSDNLYEDQELRELISSIAETVKKSQKREHNIEEVTEENTFDLEKALTDEEKPLSFGDFVAASQRDEYEKKKASLEGALIGYDQSSVVPEHRQKTISLKNMFSVSVVVLAVAGLVIAAYFLTIKEPQMADETISITETVPTSAHNQAAATIDIKEPSAQPNETATPIQDNAAPLAETVIAEAPQVTIEHISEQKPAEPPSPKAPEPARIATTATAIFYTVNVGSFKLKSSVAGVMKNLSKKGYAPTVETVTLNDKNTWYRVTVGQFKTREEAGRFAEELKEKEKIETMVVKKK